MIETKFKETEVGKIPQDWSIKELVEILTIGNGRDYKHLRKGDVPVYGTGGYITSVDEFLHDGETVCIGRKGTIDQPQYHKGKIWTVDTLFYTYNFIKSYPLFVFYLFQTIDWQAYNEATGVPSLTSKNIYKIKVKLPEYYEQVHIANTLSYIDTLISQLDKLIEKKRAIKQGAMQELLTGKKRLKGFSEPWVEKRLGDIEIKNGSMLKSSEYIRGGIPVIAGGKTPAGYHNAYNRDKDTITISGSGASAGYVALWRCPIFASDCSTINEQEGFCINYLYYSLLLKQEEIYKCQAGGAQPHIHAKDIKDISISIPCDLDEQKAIANILDNMDTEILSLESKRLKYIAIKQGMMQQLLTGKIRLI